MKKALLLIIALFCLLSVEAKPKFTAVLFAKNKAEYEYLKGFYNVRKIIYNERLEPQDIYDKLYPKKKVEKCPDNNLKRNPKKVLREVLESSSQIFIK